MATNAQLHKAMIHLAMAVDKLADAVDCPREDFTKSSIRHARELVKNAHRQMAFGEESQETPKVLESQ